MNDLGMKIYVQVVAKDINGILAKPICEKSRIFCCIAKQTLLDSKTIKYIEKLGVGVMEVS